MKSWIAIYELIYEFKQSIQIDLNHPQLLSLACVQSIDISKISLKLIYSHPCLQVLFIGLPYTLFIHSRNHSKFVDRFVHALNSVSLRSFSAAERSNWFIQFSSARDAVCFDRNPVDSQSIPFKLIRIHSNSFRSIRISIKCFDSRTSLIPFASLFSSFLEAFSSLSLFWFQFADLNCF